MLGITELEQADVPDIVEGFAAIGWTKPEAQFRSYVSQCDTGDRVVLVARVDDVFAGYVTLLWESPYIPFSRAGIPEVQDLNVLPHFRRQGIASRLLDAMEGRARLHTEEVGLAVGLTEDYGPAQRLYARRGYLPDGRGALSQGQSLRWGETIRLDDSFVLHLTRALGQ